jgi:type VI secretion system protein ImpL
MEQLLSNIAIWLINFFDSSKLTIIFLCSIALVIILLVFVIFWVEEKKKSSIKSWSKKKLGLPPLGGWISSFLTLKGFFKVNDISLFFLKVEDFLNQSVGLARKYDLPWFLMLGSEGSGKSTVVNSIGIPRIVEDRDFYHGELDPICRWFFFNKGVIIDVKGSVFFRENSPSTDEKTWRELGVLLARYRTARPLNGIILTLSAEDFYGKKKINESEITANANYVAQKLNSFQYALGMTLPVYILITKTDIIPGFDCVCAQLLSPNKQNLLGWSNPYHTNQLYRDEWMKEAFDYIHTRLDYLRYEIFATSPKVQDLDGIFIFPQELIKIYEPLTLYSNRLFEAVARNDPLLLRGIYFCGDSGEHQATKVLFDSLDHDHTLMRKISPGEDTIHIAPSIEDDEILKAKNPKRCLYFLDDLFTKKIFLEHAIAHPQTNKTLTVNRFLNGLKISTGLFLLIVITGFYYSHDSLRIQSSQLVPVFLRINHLIQDLDRVQLNKPYEVGKVFHKYATELLSMTHVVQKANLFSWFIPSSWVSPLHSDLIQSLHLIYQRTIIRSLRSQLIIKIRNLVKMQPTEGNISKNISELFDPINSRQYKLFRYFVEQMRDLLDNVYKFNNLKASVSYNDLEEIVFFAFGIKLPEDFKKYYTDFHQILLGMDLTSINVGPYKSAARKNLIFLYDYFLKALFFELNDQSLYTQLRKRFQSIRYLSKKNPIKSEDWMSFYKYLSLSVDSVIKKKNNWIDQDFFSLGKKHEELFDIIDAIDFFGKDVSQYLVDQAASGFLKLKNLLLESYFYFYKNKSKIKNTQKNQKPSSVLMSIHKDLGDLFNEGFMDDIPSSPLHLVIPDDKILDWDQSSLTKASNLIDQFEEYKKGKMTSFQGLMKDFLHHLAQSGLQKNVLALMAKSQNFVSKAQHEDPIHNAEQLLKILMPGFKYSTQSIPKIIKTISMNNPSFPINDLQRFLYENSCILLEFLDNLIIFFKPYSIVDNSFSWWDGKPGAGLKAFSVRDLDELDDLLNAQRQYITYLSNTYAKDIVDFLNNNSLIEKKDNIALVNKWKKIITHVDNYKKNKQENLIKKMENFLKNDLNVLNHEKALEQINIKSIKESSNDFFLSVFNNIQDLFLQRCEVLTRQLSLKNYNDLKVFFNKVLSNKFPFISGVNAEQGEVDPNDLKEFFKKLDSYGGETNKILNQVASLGDLAKPLKDFIEKMVELRKIFAPYVDNKSNNSVPEFDLLIDFRINRSQEKNTNYIVDWTFKVGEDGVITKADKNRQLRWTYGQPIEIGFRWPDTINFEDEGQQNQQNPNVTFPKPSNDPDQPNLNVIENQVNFTYKGRWSLLWLLRQQFILKNSLSGIYDAMPYLLKFSVPIGSNDRAIMFNLVSVMIPSDKPKQSGTLIRFIDFPINAPEVPSEIERLSTDPILTLKE